MADHPVVRKKLFPPHFSNVQKLQYPKHFKYLVGKDNLKVFVMFMDRDDKIHYTEREMAKNYMDHFIIVGKESRKFEDFRPNEISWTSVAKRYLKSTAYSHRQNVDTRVGFMLDDSKFLVKSYFTFGLRTVEPGTAHVYQTLNVPLIIYIKDAPKLPSTTSLFPYKDLHLYDRSFLMPNKCYRIPAGTTYLIFTTQKTFFSLNLVPEDYQLPMEWEDPVQNRVKKMKKMYDQPCPTPYMGDSQIQNSPDNSNIMSEFFIQEPQNVCTMYNETQNQYTLYMLEPPSSQTPYMQTETPFIQPEPSPQIPQTEPSPETPFIFEKIINVTHPDFIKAYQALTTKEMGEPKLQIPVCNSLNVEPLDLTMSLDLDNLLDCPIEDSQVQTLIEDLCASTPYPMDEIMTL